MLSRDLGIIDHIDHKIAPMIFCSLAKLLLKLHYKSIVDTTDWILTDTQLGAEVLKR